MSLIEYNLFGKINKVQRAIERYKAFEPEEGYLIAFSGGKDSTVIKRLAEMAGVKFDAHYNITSVDPPELVQFIKSMPDVSMDFPRYSNGSVITMWNLIPKKKMPPSIKVRYCCEKLKESSGKGRITVTGVRWAESARRKNGSALVNIGVRKNDRITFSNDNTDARREVEQCYQRKKVLLNPIIDWTDEDVWEFIKTEHVPYCELYDAGRKRVGCIGCPMSHNQEDELLKYPAYYDNYIRAFDRMIREREKAVESAGKKYKESWKSGEEVMDFWLHGGSHDPYAEMIGLDLEWV